ncbi:MAG TPA: helix-turn-helix transcriptional regulator, partial [Desulfosporosinus sp.]|nr:helix-turn-helix transcriptional regulator [Desulfosporosinus sp.]
VKNMDKSSDKKLKTINTLRYYREMIGVTQKEMEWRCELSKGSFTDYEAGKNEPKIRLAQRLAYELNKAAKEKEISLERMITTDDLYPPEYK